MVGIRDKLVHDYVTVNREVVWNTIHQDLPALIANLDRVLRATDLDA
jgi:uncharacterized protein with HEPN domain